MARGAAGTLALKVIGLGVAFLTTLFLARLLNAAGYGIYAYAVSWATLLYIPAMLGLDTLLVRNAAAYIAREEWGLLRGLLSTSFLAVASSSLAISAIVGTALFLTGATPEAWPAVGVALLLVPLMAFTRIIAATMRGLGHVIRSQLPEFGIRPLLLLALLLGLAMFARGAFNPVAALFAFVAAALLGTVVAGVQLIRHIPAAARSVKPRRQVRTWALSALPLVLIGGFGVVNTQADIVLLGIMKGPESAGIYRVASRGAEFIEFVLVAVNAPLAPLIARLYVQDERARLQRAVTRAARAIMLLTTPMAALLLLYGHVFLGVFGPEFLAGRSALSILIVAQLVNAFFGSVSVTLTMTGHERDSLFGMALAAGINLVLNFALIPPLGIVGASIATAISLVTWNAVLAYLVFRRLGVIPSALGRIAR